MKWKIWNLILYVLPRVILINWLRNLVRMMVIKCDFLDIFLYHTWSSDNRIFRLKNLMNAIIGMLKKHWATNINSDIHSHYHWKGEMFEGNFSGHHKGSTYLPIVRVKQSWVNCLVHLENLSLLLINSNVWNYISHTPLHLPLQMFIKFNQWNAQMCSLSLELN